MTLAVLAAASRDSAERVTDVIGDVLDLGRLVVVRQDHRIALRRQPPDLRRPVPPGLLRTRRGAADPAPASVPASGSAPASATAPASPPHCLSHRRRTWVSPGHVRPQSPSEVFDSEYKTFSPRSLKPDAGNGKAQYHANVPDPEPKATMGKEPQATMSKAPQATARVPQAAASEAPRFAHEALAVVLQVRDQQLNVLLWRRGAAPFEGRWAAARRPARGRRTPRDLPGPAPGHQGRPHRHRVPGAAGDPQRSAARPAGPHPGHGLPGPGGHRRRPAHPGRTPPGIRSRTCRLPRSTTGRSPSQAATGCGPSCPTPTSASPWPPRRSRSRSSATSTPPRLGHPVSATNLQRVLTRRGVIEATAAAARPTPAGGRPATLYRFAARTLVVTNPFAAFRPPSRSPAAAR